MEQQRRWSVEELRAELNRYEAELRAAGKARNTVATYLQHPERFLAWLEGRYRPNQINPGWEPGGGGGGPGLGGGGGRGGFDGDGLSRGRSRYDPLKRYLAERNDPVVRLSFAEIERIIGGPLPPSARRHRPWWGNERSGSHVHASSWMGAGRRSANVALNAGTVDFIR
jgi:hypothetical protein